VRIRALPFVVSGFLTLLFAPTNIGAQWQNRQELFRMLQDTAWENRVSAIKYLRKTGDSAYAPYILRRLADKDERVRICAAEALWVFKNSKVMPVLLEVLAGSDENAKGAAVRAIRMMTEHTIVDNSQSRVAIPLIPMLDSRRMQTRRDAACALGNLGDPRAAPKLAGALLSKDLELAYAATTALIQIKDSSTVDTLIQILGMGKHPFDTAAARILGKTKNPRASAPLLTALFKESDHRCRQRIAEALESLKDKEAIPLLAKALEDKYSPVRPYVINILRHYSNYKIIHSDFAPDTLLISGKLMEKLDHRLKQILSGDILPHSVRLEVVEIQDSSRASGKKDRLAVGDTISAVMQLNTWTDPPIGSILKGELHRNVYGNDLTLKMIDSTPYPNPRDGFYHQNPGQGTEKKLDTAKLMLSLFRALDSAGKNGRYGQGDVLNRLVSDKKYLPQYIRALRCRDPFVRDKMAQIIGNLHTDSSSAVPALIQCLKDKYLFVVTEAAVALGKYGPAAHQAIDALLHVSSDSYWDASFDKFEFEYLKIRSLEALSKIGNLPARSIPVLQNALRSSSISVRSSAIDALGEVTEEQEVVVKILMHVIEHDTSYVRVGAVESIGMLHSAEFSTIPLLMDILKDSKESGSRSAAAKALGRIATKDDNEVIDLLIATSADPQSWGLRQEALQALYEIGGNHEKVINALRNAQNDSNEQVRHMAGYYLKKLMVK
jgi:HEAT repeat protein